MNDDAPTVMQARGLLEIALYTSDLPALEHFYMQVMGLEQIARTEGRNSVLRCGNAAMILFDRSASSAPGGLFPPHGSIGPGHIAFVVSDEAELGQWRQHLERHGVTIEREVSWPEGGTSIYFRDPDGNSLEFAPPTLWGWLGARLLGHPRA